MERNSFSDYLINMEALMNQAEAELDLDTLRCFLKATEQKINQLNWLWFE